MKPAADLRPCLLGTALAVIVAASLLTFHPSPSSPSPPPGPAITLDRIQAPALSLAAHRIPTPAPVPEPTPAATAAPEQASAEPAAPVSYSPGSVKSRIAAAWPGPNVAKVIVLVGCETGHTFDPGIVGPQANDGSRYLGLFQADATFRATYGWGSGSVEDQTMMAWKGKQTQGWGAWPRCSYVAGLR